MQKETLQEALTNIYMFYNDKTYSQIYLIIRNSDEVIYKGTFDLDALKEELLSRRLTLRKQETEIGLQIEQLTLGGFGQPFYLDKLETLLNIRSRLRDQISYYANIPDNYVDMYVEDDPVDLKDHKIAYVFNIL